MNDASHMPSVRLRRPCILLFSERTRIRTIMEIGLLQCDYTTIDAANVYSAVMKAAQLMPDAVLIDVTRKSTKGLIIIKSLRRAEKTRQIPIMVLAPEEPAEMVDALRREYGLESEGEWRGVAVVRYPIIFARVVEALGELLTE